MNGQNKTPEVLSEVNPEETMPEVAAEPIEVRAEEPVAADPIEAIRGELAELKSLIVGQKQTAAEPVVDQAFRALYPHVTEEEIPDTVWEAARGGLPLEAAYALYERREAMRRSAANEVNRRNARGTWGRAETEADGFLSPDEVREMSPAEVRANYARIMASMKHWT